jgi:CoA:oxalate CoA-transferase
MAGLASLVGNTLHQRTRQDEQVLQRLMLVRGFKQLEGELVALVGSDFADVTAFLKTHQHAEEFADAAAQAACDFTASEGFGSMCEQFQNVESLIQGGGSIAGSPARFVNTRSNGVRWGHKSELAYYIIFLMKIPFHIYNNGPEERYVTEASSSSKTTLPLTGILVLDFSQFLSGSLATLRLADLGARVIKIERPGTGDLGRSLYLSDTDVHGENTLFHAINRNKESFAADLKNPQHQKQLHRLISHADVMVQNFRPGVMERLGFGYEAVSNINPRLVYGEVSGYGNAKAWRDRPGQDLLAQARSGIMWLSGNDGDPPTPMALAIADMLAGHNLGEGILACLVRRGVTGRGGFVETSLIEALLDFQFEVLTTHMNDGRRAPRRSALRNAHAYLAAPYGVYDTANGHLALAMTHLPTLGSLLDLPELTEITDSAEGFRRRDEIKGAIANRVKEHTTEHWLEILNAADIWCAEVLDWPKLFASVAFEQLAMVQTLGNDKGVKVLTTRCPIRLDGSVLNSERLAPKVGQHTDAVRQEFDL